MIPDDQPWMYAALGSCGFGELRRDTDRAVELRLLRIFSDSPTDATSAIAIVTRTGALPHRVDLAFKRLSYLELVQFRRGGWVISAAGKVALASQDAPPVVRVGPSMATKQLSLF